MLKVSKKEIIMCIPGSNSMFSMVITDVIADLSNNQVVICFQVSVFPSSGTFCTSAKVSHNVAENC